MLPQSGGSFGRYDIGRRLGQGGMGVVFAATHRDLGRDVALKILSPDLSDEQAYRNRFLREARALALLDSPYVVRVYDAGEQDGWLFIATELVPDGDLHQLLAAGGLPLHTAAELVGQVAEGLDVAHRAGILHRDIKPSNVLIRRLPSGGLRGILCDLGISTFQDAEHTVTAGVIGTPGYMAPERHEGSDASLATDIYSLGCLLWATVTGRAPYGGTASQVIIGHVRGEIPQLPGRSADEIAVNAVLRRAMAKDPTDRYPTARELAGALASIGAETDSATTIVSAPAPLIAQVPQDQRPTRLGPQAPALPPPPPALPNRSKGAGRAWLVAGLAVVLALAGGAAAVALLSGGDPPDHPAAHTTTTTTSPPHRPTHSVDKPTARVTAVEHCWTGEVATGDCGWPDGVAGLRWVFPSIANDCSIQHNARIDHSEEAWCGAAVHYSGWVSQAAMLAHYRPEFLRGHIASPGPGLVARRISSPDAAYKVLIYYAEQRAPWDVTVYAASRAAYQRVVAGVVFRPAGELAQK